MFANESADLQQTTRMPSRRTLRCVLLSLLVSGWLTAVVNGNSRPRPAFIIILTDDQGYQDLGCFGSPAIRTPQIDRMAREGMRFTDFYAQAVCGPSRAALMTGCYPIRVAEPENRKHQHTILHPQEITLAEILQDAGYATACIGKWHLGRKQGDGWDPATMPNQQGFDEFFGTPLFNGFTVAVEDATFRSPLLRNDRVVVSAVPNWNTITADYTREAVRFIRDNRDRPFFLYLAHNMPHIPLGAGPEFRGRSPVGPYGDAIEEIDWSTGRILETLRELDLDSRTFVFFTSDNGPWIETTRGMQPGGRPFIPRNHSGTAEPLRGFKMLTWDGGLRVPAVAWWPGRIPAGTVCSEVAATIDLLPTLAAYAGAKIPVDRVMDGHDLRPLLHGDPDAVSPHLEQGFFYYRYTTLEAVRSGIWKLVLPRTAHPPWTGWSGRFHGNAVDELSLFHLGDDIGEQRNVAARHPDVVQRLLTLVEQARQELGDYDRTGSGARFLDEGPRRPGRVTREPPADAVQYDELPPVGPLRFTFEDGDPHGWTIASGRFGAFVTDRDTLPAHTRQPFNKQGRWLIFTGQNQGRLRGDDRFTGVLESPEFELTGDTISFLAGGGKTEQTRVVLVDDTGRALRTASGNGNPVLNRVVWDVGDLRGRVLRLRIIDQSESDWGHVTFDDFSCRGRLVSSDKQRVRSGDTASERDPEKERSP